MSNKIINLKKDNECLNQEKEENDLIRKNLIYKYEFVNRAINFFIDNFKKDDFDKNNSDNIFNLFSKYDIFFYDNICSIKEKLNLENRINILNNEINTDKNIINNINNNRNELKDINAFSNIMIFFGNYCEIIKEIGSLIIEYSDNILKEINNLEKNNDKNQAKINEESKQIVIKEDEKNDLDKNININDNKEFEIKNDSKQENDDKLVNNINIENNKDFNNEDSEKISTIDNSSLIKERLNIKNKNINTEYIKEEIEKIKENIIEKEEIKEKDEINKEVLNKEQQKEDKNKIDIDAINKNEEYNTKEEESSQNNNEIKNIKGNQNEMMEEVLDKKEDNFGDFLIIKNEDDKNNSINENKDLINSEKNIDNKIKKSENKDINIKHFLEDLVEEIINSFIKIIITEPNFILKNILSDIEQKVINELITQILQEKKEAEEQNKIEIKKENIEKPEVEIKKEGNNKDILNDEINNQNNKINEIIKEQENDSFSENNIKNIDSLLGDVYEEEENVDINKEIDNKEIVNKEIDNKEIIEEKEKKDKKQEENEDKKDFKLNNEDINLNSEEKDILLDKELEELDDLLNLNIQKNQEKNEDEIIYKKGEESNKNNDENIDLKMQKPNELSNLENNNIIINLSQENIKNEIINYEKENIDESLKKKEIETDKIKEEYDFELDDEEDIDKIIKDEDNKKLKSNISEINNNIQEKKEISNEIKNEEKNKNNEINIMTKKEKENQKKVEQKLSLPLFANIRDKEFFIESAIKKILGETSILQNETKILIGILFKNEESLSYFFPYFLNFLKKRMNNKIIFLQSYDNFKTLIFIFESNLIKEKRADIFDLIIELSQYIKYGNNYLYQYLRRKIGYFQQTNFWKALIDNLLINSLNIQVKFIINRENKKRDLKEKPEQKEKKSFWKELFSNSFSDEYSLNEEENHIQLKKSDNDILLILELMSYTKYIKGYHQLNNELKKELDDFGKKSLEKILYKYIKTMSIFGFNFNEMKILTLNFSAQFGFNNELKENFINLIDCYKYKNYNQIKINLYLKNNNNIINEDSLICLLSNIFIFLPIKDRIKLFILNKKLNMKSNLKKVIFNKILRQKNLSFNKRLIIWEDILNISKLKKQYNYSEIKESTLKKISLGELKKDTRLFNNNETINKDVSRTVFLVDRIENQNKLKNILSCLNILITSIGYYQGISYIAAFLLQILDFNEEKTFFYMLALESQTDYKNLFINNLELLNNNFKIFEKILEIGLPDIYLHLNRYNVISDYYTPSWFLTIFACVSPIFNKDNISKFCILVFEKFILDGWSAVFIAGFTSLKLLSKEFLNTNEFNIYNYMTTDFNNKDIFKNSNFSKVENDYIINSEFIDNYLISLVNKICNFEKKFNVEE